MIHGGAETSLASRAGAAHAAAAATAAAAQRRSSGMAAPARTPKLRWDRHTSRGVTYYQPVGRHALQRMRRRRGALRSALLGTRPGTPATPAACTPAHPAPLARLPHRPARPAASCCATCGS